MLQDFSGIAEMPYLGQVFGQKYKLLDNSDMYASGVCRTIPFQENSAISFPELCDPAEEDPGDRARLLHSFAGNRPLKILIERQHKKVQPAVEMSRFDRQVDMF